MLNTSSSTKRIETRSSFTHWERGEYGLTLKQQAFVDHYLADPNRNATEAYRKAYQNGNERTCNVSASRLLRHRKVLKCIEESERKQRQKAMQKLDLSHEQWLRSIAACVYADPRQLVDSEGKFVHPHELPDGLVPAIEQIEVLQYEGNVLGWRYRLSSKPKALELLGKAMRWLEQTGVNLNIEAPRFNFNIGHTQDQAKVIDSVPPERLSCEVENASNPR